MLNVWSYPRLPDGCYLVVDRPCQSGAFTHWNYRPCSAAHPLLIEQNQQFNVTLTPIFQEFFSNGVHFATQSYELGDKNLDLETSYNLELSFKTEFDWVSTELNLFHNWSKNYIIQQRTGKAFNLETEQINSSCTGNCLLVYQTVQQDARFYGFESQINFPLWNSENHKLDGGVFGDYVRGKLDAGGNVPRLPPLRYGVQLDYIGYKDFAAGLRLTRAEKQTQVGDNETSTKDYLLLDANINYT